MHPKFPGIARRPKRSRSIHLAGGRRGLQSLAGAARARSRMIIGWPVLVMATFAAASTPPPTTSFSLPPLTIEGGLSGAAMGWSVSTAGDVNGDGYSDLIVGAPGFRNGETDEGRAYVHLGGPDGITAVANWSVEPNQVGAACGQCVATAGDVNGDGFDDVIVGIPFYDHGELDEGLAVAYYGSPSGLGANGTLGNADWTLERNVVQGGLGKCVHYAGDVNGDGFDDVLVSLPGYSNGQAGEGQVSLYLGSASGLGSTAAWSVESNLAHAQMGLGLGSGDLNGDGYSDIVIGTNQWSNPQPQEGAVWVYFGGPGGPDAVADWFFESNLSGANTGFHMGVVGDVNGDGYADLAVGVTRWTETIPNEGAVLVFHGSATGPSAQPDWIGASGQAASFYGLSSGTAGDWNGDGYADLLVGAVAWAGDQPNEGKIDVFLGSATGLASAPLFSIEGDQTASQFGYAVTSAGDLNGDGLGDIAVGAYHFFNPEPGEGEVRIFYGASSLPAATPTASFPGSSDNSLYGHSVALNGDVNGDGYSDMIVGVPGHFGGFVNEGRVLAYYGGPAGLGTTPSWIEEGDRDRGCFGFAVSYAGDINADGYDDVLVGSPSLLPGSEINPVGASLYLGSATGLASTPAWTAGGLTAATGFGRTVARVGDINLDGFADIAVGAPFYSNGQAGEGAVFLYLGNPGGISSTPSWVGESNSVGALLGTSLTFAGDTNGDGLLEFAAGAPGFIQAGLRVGAFWVWGADPSGVPDFRQRVNGPEHADDFGRALAGGVDVDGDGTSDMFVGSPGADFGNGRVFLFHGAIDGIYTTPALTFTGEGFQESFGVQVALCGDIDRDGFGDLLIADPRASNPENQGRVFLYSGDPSQDPPLLLREYRSPTSLTAGEYGLAMGGGGDVNGDGQIDFAIAAPFEELDGPDVGFVYFYAGGGDYGLERVFGQQEPDGRSASPLAFLGDSNTSDSVRLRSRQRSAAGRIRTRTAYEIQAVPRLLDGAEVRRTALVDPGAPAPNDGAHFDQVITANELTTATPYHWRMRTESDSPFFPRSPWVGLPQNSVQEADFRTADVTSGVGDTGTPERRALRAEPNPFAGSTVISFSVPRPTALRVEVLDASGRRVVILEDALLDAGQHEISWDGRAPDGRRVACGIYFVRTVAAQEIRILKVVRVD